MGSRPNVAWLLFLLLKVSRLKGNIDASIDLQCYQLVVPNNIMNCSWFIQRSFDVTTTYVLHCKSLKFNPGQTHSEQAERGQNWLAIGRSKLTRGDNYSVWVEVFSADWNATSKKLNFSLDDIGQRQLLPQEEVGQEGHDLEDLKPFTSYEVQARCIPENGNGFWSEWSLSQTFTTPEAAPLGQVDVWQKVGVSENGEPSLLLLWKALDPESAQGVIQDYEVIYREHSKKTHKMLCGCCSASLPPTAEYAWISAHNSITKTLPANLSLEQTDLPGPEEVQVLAVPGLGFNVTWKASTSPRWVQPEEYIVEWEEEEGLSSSREALEWIRRPGSSDSALVRGNFKPKIAYRVGLHALYPEGSSRPVNVRAYFKEEVPSAGPQALQDRSISSTASLISWQEVPLASRNGHIIGYTLYLKDPTSENVSCTYITAAKRSYNLSNLKPGTTYQLWMTGSTLAGEGASSPPHYFSTPGVSNWQTIVISFFTVGFLFILAGIVVSVKYRWVLSFCRKILPFWCWQKIPNPGHSSAILKMNGQSTLPGMDTPTQHLGQCPEEADIVEIKELPAPEPKPSPAHVVNSGYEKHFMPTLEDLQKLV
nr:interleukin-27 receptor subunit alpha [Pogona vitticeps]